MDAAVPMLMFLVVLLGALAAVSGYESRDGFATRDDLHHFDR